MRREIIGNDHLISEEERELARSCGSEAAAFSRSCGAQGTIGLMDRTLNGIPHADYRVLVIAATRKLAKNPKSPTTKEYAAAKAKVDEALVERGLSIVVPHARPGRVTR